MHNVGKLRWLMTSEEASVSGASAYPPPCIDPSFFEGRFGPRQGAARIPPERYKEGLAKEPALDVHAEAKMCRNPHASLLMQRFHVLPPLLHSSSARGSESMHKAANQTSTVQKAGRCRGLFSHIQISTTGTGWPLGLANQPHQTYA